MKISTHERILRIWLRISKERVPIVFIKDYDITTLKDSSVGCYKFKDQRIYLRRHEVDAFVLAHEFFHAYQHKKIHKRKYRKGFHNYKSLPKNGRDDFWGFRRYKFQRIEREANNFALRYCLLTFQFSLFRQNYVDLMKDYFEYRLCFKLIKDAYNSAKSFFKKSLNM